MSTIILKLWGTLSKEKSDSINYKIAETLLQNINSFDDTSSESLAKLCNVSKASISRFSKDVGYKDFYDFRMDLSTIIHNYSKTEIYRGKRSLGISQIYFDNCINNIKQLSENIDELEIEKIARILFRTEHVFLLGNMQSGNVAENLQYNLFLLNKMTTSITNVSEQKNLLRNLKGDELVIIFSASGTFFYDYFEEKCIPKIPNGVNIYLVTSNPEINNLGNIKILNAKTGLDISALGLSIQIISDLIYLKYESYINNHT